MNVKELRDALSEMVRNHQGDRPVMIQDIQDGVTFAKEVKQAYVSEPYDGRIVWLFLGEPQPPEWMG